MSETSPNQGVSTEVKGEFSPIQRQEYGFLGQQVLQARGLDAQDPKNLEDIKAFMDDTLERGLQMQGRIWFSPADSIVGTFDSGLSAREKVIKELKAAFEDSEKTPNLEYLSRSEENELRDFINNASVFSPDLSVQEDFLSSVEKRKKNVIEFQRAIFDNSPLASDAKELRNTVRSSWESGSFTQQEIENALYRNFILHMALYLKPGLQIEPKDVAALSELWDTAETKVRGEESVISKMREFARRAGFDDQAVGIYTDRMLDQFSFYTEGQTVDLDTLKETNDFIFSERSINQEEHDYAQNFLGPESSRISPQDLETAEKTAAKAFDLYNAFEQSGSKENADEYINALKSLNAFELVYFYHKTMKDNTLTDVLERDIKELPDPTAFVKALKYVYNEEPVSENGDLILDTNVRNELRAKIGGLVKEKILSEELKLEDIVSEVPSEFVLEIALEIPPTDEQRTVLTNLDTKTWIYFLRQSGALVKENEEDETKKINFSADSEKLKTYFEQITPEKQRQIIQGLQRTIQF